MQSRVVIWIGAVLLAIGVAYFVASGMWDDAARAVDQTAEQVTGQRAVKVGRELKEEVRAIGRAREAQAAKEGQ